VIFSPTTAGVRLGGCAEALGGFDSVELNIAITAEPKTGALRFRVMDLPSG
jgi:hypothetical protein